MNNATIRGHVAMQQGRLEEAVGHYETGEELQSRMPGVAPMDAPCYLVWALAGLGHINEANAALERAQAMPDLARWYTRPVIVAAGRALLAGDAAAVDAAIAAAPGPMPFDIAIMRTVGAQVLGGEVRIPWLREALDIYERAGATAYRERMRSLLRAAGGPVPRRRRPATTLPDELVRRGVTAREAEVLHLLGEGRSNADIASRLFLSVRTVETHVSSLLAKLQARSRGQLIAMSGSTTREG